MDILPYPELSASSLTAPATRDVTATNDAGKGFTSADALKQLRSDDNETIYLASDGDHPNMAGHEQIAA